MKIYFAGPLFTLGERMFNAEITGYLRKWNHEVFLPQEQEQEGMSAEDIFWGDVRGIDWSQVVVANMDGPDPDSGTCWECGYAFMKKPIVAYRTDFRAANDAPDSAFNLMLSKSATKVLILPRAVIPVRAANLINEAVSDIYAGLK